MDEIDNVEKSITDAKDLLNDLTEEITPDWCKALKFLISYAEITRYLLGRAVVFRSESSESLSSIKCSSCPETYWVNCGDLSDVTVYESDCYRCPFCGHVDIITDKIIQSINEVDTDDAEDGFKTPNEAIGL